LQFDEVQVSNHQPGEYFLVLSRLLGYKRIDLAIEACEKLKLSLKIIGSGRHLSYLKKLAGDCTQFLGFCDEVQIKKCLSECAALIFPGEEDFGIVPLEAMAAGKPVIAYGAGGVLETVVPNQTGLFFETQSVEALVMALQKFKTMTFDSKKIVQHTKQFSESHFRKQIMSLLQ
jgi:glycosyltransferase involved in cell wall biosynthesis